MNLPNTENFTEKFNRQSKLGFGAPTQRISLRNSTDKASWGSVMDWNKEEYDKISVSLFRIQTYWVHGKAFIITFIINEDKNQSFFTQGWCKVFGIKNKDYSKIVKIF